MNEKRDKDIRFLFHTVALALISLAVLQAIRPYLGGIGPKAEEIRAVREQIVPVAGQAVPGLLRAADGKPAMLVIYASWCPYCKLEMPYLVGFLKGGQMEGVHPLFLSIDSHPEALAGYLVQQGYQGAFTPYLLKDNKLREVLAQSGAHFWGQIPYVGFFDAEGRLMAELPGQVERKDIADALEYIKSQAASGGK